MTQNSRPRSEAGLTLLEIMIAMAVLAFVSIAIYEATVRSFRLTFSLGAEANEYSALALSLAAVETDFSQIFSPLAETLPAKSDAPPGNFWSSPVRSDGLRRARFKGEKEKVTFITNSNRRVEADSPQSEFMKVTWEIESNAGGTYSLYRATDWDIYHYEDGTATKPNRVALMDNLTSAKFTYYRKENKAWEETWDSEGQFAKPNNRFPPMISLKVEIPDPLNPAKQQAWEIIVKPNQDLNILSAEDKEKLKSQFLN
jgi:prepilin-type N-terminal cleavage/methylation domain-containing protein